MDLPPILNLSLLTPSQRYSPNLISTLPYPVTHCCLALQNDVYEALGLPALTSVDLARLSRGERIQRQSRDGRTGSGLVVVDVPAHPDIVFRTLQQFERYHALIPTIRAAKIDRHSSGVIARAEYALSKFHLKVHVKHTIVPDKVSHINLVRAMSPLISRFYQ